MNRRRFLLSIAGAVAMPVAVEAISFPSERIRPTVGTPSTGIEGEFIVIGGEDFGLMERAFLEERVVKIYGIRYLITEMTRNTNREQEVRTTYRLLRLA